MINTSYSFRDTLARSAGAGRGDGACVARALLAPLDLILRLPRLFVPRRADMIMGLKEGQEKMSKSDPNSAIFMEDTAAEVKSKIRGAFCPPGVVAGNPCLDWIEHIVFPYFAQRGGGGGAAGAGWLLKRSAENGGDVLFADYAALRESYASGALHPGDVKSNLTDALNAILEPVRRHFAAGEPAKLLASVKSFALQAAKKAAAAAPVAGAEANAAAGAGAAAQ